MKTISIGHYVGTMGNVVLEQQTFIKKLLNTLQLLQPQSKEFTNQLNQLKDEYEEAISNQNFESNENISEFDSVTSQIQKDLESIHIQLRVLKSANASSRKGTGQPDLTAIEKNKKLKQSFKEYKAESTLQLTDIKSALSELKNELKNSNEMMTNIQANLQASRDEFDSFRTRIPTEDENEEMNSQVNDMQVELEAIKTVLEVMHQGTATTEDLEKMKKSHTRSVNILKNSMQNVRDEINNIKLLKQGKIPPNVLTLVEELDQSVNSLQDDMEGVKKDAEDKSSILTKAQQDLVSLMSEMEKLKANPIEIDTSSLPINDRMNLIEERLNSIADNQMKAVNNYNAQRAFLKYFKEEFATDIVERVSELEKRMDELPSPDTSAADQKNQNKEEYQHLDQKITQMIQDLETSNIQERSINASVEKPDFPHTVEELRSFQKALRAQAQDDEQSIYQFIEPSNLPLVVQSMDQLLNEMYTEIYQIRDNLTNEISELKQASNPQTIKCLKHELANIKNRLNQMGTVSRDVDLNQSDNMQWPVLRSPGKKKEPSPFVEGLKTKIEDLVQDMNNAEDQEDDDINQIKPTMGEAQDKLNNMLSICNEIIEHEEEDQIEQITPEKMWEVLNELKGKVTTMEEKELIKTRDIQIEEEEVDEVKEAIEELRNTSESLRNEIKQLKEMNETQEALEQIGEKMNSLTERINEISGHQSETESTINAHTTKILEQADEIQEKIRQIEALEQTLNEFISTHHENDDQSIANMKAELEELKDQLTNIHQAHEEHGSTVNSQINDIHQKLKEFEEGAFFKSPPRANPIVQQLQKQISDLIKQMEDSQLKDEEDTTGELRPTFSQAQEQLETVQRTLDEILAQENERLMMESPSELVKNVQNLNNKVRALEESLQQRGQNGSEVLQQSFSEEEAIPSTFNTQTRAINLNDDNERPSEQTYELMNRVQKLERSVNKLNQQFQEATDLINKRHNSLKKVKATVNENVTNRLDKIEDDLNHHISDHPVSQDIQVAVPPDSYVKSQPNPVIEQLNQQIEELVQKIQTEELENLATTELNESGSHLKPELDQLKEQLTKLQETLRKLQESQIYVPAVESLQGISDTISTLQDKVNNQSKMIRELKDQADIKNNESVSQLKEDMKSLKKQLKETLQNEEHLSNEVQDQLLPINQKIESLERQIANIRNNVPEGNFQESNIPLVERSISDNFNSGSPSKKSGNMNSIEALKTSIEQLVEKIDDDKLNEEEDTTGEFRNNLGQTRKDLETLQTSINALLRKANDPSLLNGVNEEIRKLQSRVSRLESATPPTIQTRDVQFAAPDDEELNQLRENVEKLTSENEGLKHDIKCIKYEIKQLRNRAPVQEEDNNNNTNNQLVNDDENNESVPVDALKQEIEELRNLLNNQENKVEQIQDQINQFKENNSGFFGSTQPLKRKPSKAVMDIKDHVDNVLDKMSNPSIREETNDSEDLKPSMDQAQEDLEKLQLTLTNILAQPDKEANKLTPDGLYKLVQENQDEIRAVAENGEAVNKNLIQLTETVRCIKHEMKKFRSDLEDQQQNGFQNFFKSSQKTREVNPAVSEIQNHIDTLSRKLEESDLTESDTKERDLNGKVAQTQDNLRSLREALQSILDQEENEELTPETLVTKLRELQADTVMLKFELKQLQENQDDSFEDKISQDVDKIRVRIDEVSANQIKAEENVKGQLRRLTDYKSEIDQTRSELSEIKEMLSTAEEWMCITDQTKPEERKASPLVESLTEQIDQLVENLNKPDMQNETSNNEDLEERRSQAQTHLARLREALERAKEAQQEPLTFTPTSLLEAIKDLQQKVAYLEFQDGQKSVQTREIQIEEEEADEENVIPSVRGFPERHRNPVIEDINDRIESLVKTLHHPDMESNDANGEIRPEASSTENELRLLRKSLEFLQRQQEEMDSLTPENLYKAICNLQVQAIQFEDAISSFKCIKHEVKKLRSIELNNTNEQLQKLKRKSKDVKQKLNSHLEENQRIIDEINSPRKKKVNPAIEAVKREIETLNEKMNDPSFTEEEGKEGPNSGELSSRKQQAQQHLDLLSDTLTKLLEQEEPAVLNMDTLHQMIHDMYTKIALLEVQNEQTAKQNSEEMQNIFRSIKDEVNHMKEEQEIQTRDINLERDNKLDEIEGKISQLEQTVESMEEINSSFASFTPLMKSSSKKPNPRAEELKNQIDLLVSQMDDPSLLDEDNQDELKPAMDKSKDELQQLRDILQHFNDEEGFTPAVFMEVTTGLDNRVKALEEDKVNQVQTREINLEAEQRVENLSQSFDSLKSSLDELRERLGNEERKEEEIQKNVDEVCRQIEDLQSRLGEVESQPSQIIAGFNTFKKRPINPSMEALKNRIDELMTQMNDPELQNEEENKNTKLKPSISKAETELRQLQETLKRLMEQEEPVAITPQSLHELIHQLQAQVAKLEVVTGQDIEESEEKFETINNDLATFNERVQTIIQNQEKLIDQYNSMKSKFDSLEEQVSLKENEINDKIDAINGNVEDLQSHVNELESQPTQYLSGFPENQTLSRPVNPVIRGIQNRIDELVQQMNDPTLQDEDNKSNEELQQNMTNAEAELQQLNGQLKHLMEQEEPIVVTPEDLLEMLHNLQAKVASLEASEDLRNDHAEKQRTLSSITQSQAQLIETFNDLKTNLDEFKNQLHDANENGEELDKNVNDLCQKVEETQSKIAEFEGLPTPLQVSGFTTSQSNSTPIIQAIQKRIDELVKEMKHPALQNEDNEANTRLKPSMTKAENELLRLQETLKRLEEEDQITPNKLYGMIQSTQDRCQGIEPRVEKVESDVNDHIENHPSPEPAWAVMPREPSPAVQDLKRLIDEICENMQVPDLDEDDETTSQIKPNIENAQGDLLSLQQKLNEYLQEQEKPAVLTPDRIYNMILDLQSELAKVRKYQIKQQRAQAKAEAEAAAVKERNVNLDFEFEEEEEEGDEESEPKRNNNNKASLENEVDALRRSIDEIKSEMKRLHHAQQQQLPSPVQEYNNFKQTYANGIPKTEDELVTYIERLENIAKGFDRNIIKAHEDIKKVEEIKSQLQEDTGFGKSIRDELNHQAHTIRCIKHEIKLLKTSNENLPTIKSRDISLVVDDENNEKKRGSRRRRRNNNQPTEEEQVKAMQDRLSTLESKMDSFKLQYNGFNKPQDENGNANQHAAVEALNTSINKFIERNIESDDDEEVERLHPDIEKSQIKLRALKGTLDDVLYQQRQNELAVITPQSLNADIIDVKKHVEKTESDINEINDRIDTLDENQEQAVQSFNNFKNEDLPNQLSQIKKEIALLQESKEEHQNELSRLNQSIDELNEEDKKKAEAINQLNNEISQLKEALAERDQSISLLRENVNKHSDEIEEVKNTMQQDREQNAQQFDEVKENIGFVSNRVDELKNTVEQNQDQNNQKFNEVEQNISTVSNNLAEMKNTFDEQLNEVKQKISTVTNNLDELKNTVEQNQDQNNQKFREVKQSISTITNNLDELRNNVEQNQEQNNQQFNQIKQNISTITNYVDELKGTVEQNQEQNNRKFNEVEQEISTVKSKVEENQEQTAQQINELKNTVEQNQEQTAQKFSEVEGNISTVANNLDEFKNTVEQNQEQTAQQINELKSTVEQNQEQTAQQINELKSTVEQNQEQTAQKFNEVEGNISTVTNDLNELRENLSTVTTDIDEIKSAAAQHQEQNTQQFRQVKDEISSAKQALNNEISSAKQTLDNEIASVNENLTNEINNLKAALHKQEEGNAMINSHSKNIEYIQKILSKHDKNLKAVIEKEKGVEEFIQQNDPVSKDDFQKLEMKYDKLIEQIHSNISVIANGQQSQHESFKKELNNLSQNNSELQSEASLGTGHAQGLDDLTKKVSKIFKHVKSQDEKINKLRTDVDGLLKA